MIIGVGNASILSVQDRWLAKQRRSGGDVMGWVVLAPGTLQRITDRDFAEYARSDLTWPKVFMTGDGHRTPAFAWTTACPRITDFFTRALAAQRLYAYVEVRPSAVTANLVPDHLAGLHAQGRIIGWELPLFEQLQPGMDKSLQVATLEIDLARLDSVAGVLAEFDILLSAVAEILRVNNTMDLRVFDYIGEIMECLETYRRRAEFKADTATKLTVAAKNYFNACMALRCSATYHQAVGDVIQRSLLQAPDAIHLIACGDNHLTCQADPLQQFIGLDVMHTLGWIDASHG